MISIERDAKAWNVFIISKTDSEGFHHQLALTFDDMRELVTAMKNVI